MNHKFLALAALGALTLGACSTQDVPAPAPADGDGTVTFSVAMPAAMQTRGYADGKQEKTLSYAVYDATTDELVFASGDGTAPEATGGPIKYELKLNLVKGKTYNFIFWADAKDNTHYTFSAKDKTVTVNYTETDGKLTATGNDDTRDAFFQAVKDVTISGPMTQDVELRRPFAQINFGTNDIKEAAAAKTEIAKTDLLVKGVYTKLNLLTGIASEAKDVTFTSDAFAAEGEEFPADKTYTYLTMDYVLTGIQLEADENVQEAKREVFDATMTFTFDDGQSASVPVTAMPVQRNYRTNVFGSLLTSPLDFKITVVPDFYEEPGIPVEIIEPKAPATDAEGNALLTSASELAYIAKAVNSGSDEFKGKTIKLQNDLDLGTNEFAPIGDYQANTPFSGTFDGQGHTIKGGVFKNLNGDGSTAGLIGYMKNATVKELTIDGIKVESNHFAAAVVGLIHFEGGLTPLNLISNVKVINADIRSAAFADGDKYDGGNKVGGIYGYSAYNIHLMGCSVEKSYIQGYREVGGLAGTIGNLGDARTGFSNNTVKDCTIAQDLRHDYKDTTPTTVGEIYGQLLNSIIDDTNTATGCKIITITE